MQNASFVWLLYNQCSFWSDRSLIRMTPSYYLHGKCTCKHLTKQPIDLDSDALYRINDKICTFFVRVHSCICVIPKSQNADSILFGDLKFPAHFPEEIARQVTGKTLFHPLNNNNHFPDQTNAIWRYTPFSDTPK